MSDEPLTERERFPLLTDAGRDMLRRLRQHPHAPRFNYPCGERLDAAGLATVREYAAGLRSGRTGWRFGDVPAWLGEFVRSCRNDVPYYRDCADWSEDFFALPTTTRIDLRREPWSFVPDASDLSQLIVYRTSGTTGNLLNIISHPVAPNRYLPLFETALAACGVKIEGRNRVSIIQVCSQRRTFTLASVMSYFDSAGFAKINLNLADWNHPDDRRRFLEDCQPEIYTGDPFAFDELARLDLTARPKALISSATTLLPGQRARLEAHFDCPVIDLYALNEAGPVAFSRDAGHEVLPHNLYVEILDDAGRPVEPGQRGEIVVTGGVNPNLPLVRYRTGDFAALDFQGAVPRLVEFAGRQPVHFRCPAGRIVSSIDVTVALFEIPLPFFSLRQNAGGDFLFRTRCDTATQARVEEALREVLGGDQTIAVEQLPLDHIWEGKWIQYSSAL
jgi:phenylacetate-CoA ligase